MTSISYGNESTVSANNFELFPSTLKTDLILPPCIWDNTNMNICTRTAEQELIILEIYLGYTLAMKHRKKIEKILSFDAELAKLNEGIYYLSMTLIDNQEAYTDHLMDRLKIYEKEKEAIKRKNILNNILWGTAGVGIGAIIMSIIFTVAK